MKTGQYFFHSKWLDTEIGANKLPAICKVTKRGKSGFYYRQVYLETGKEELGMPYFIADDECWKYVRGENKRDLTNN